MAGAGEWIWSVGAFGLGAAWLGLAAWWPGRGRFERAREAERERLLARLGERATETGTAGDPRLVDASAGGREGGGGPGDAFTPMLVEYYAYGLTQARASFATSQWFAGVGAAVLLFGIGLGVWKAESGGEAYIGVVTSSVGVVVTLVGQLFHRRADAALRHMAAQSASLREDRRAAEGTRQAIALLEEIADPDLRARLQAGLVIRLSGAELPPAGS
ncbi:MULTISPECIES: TRADD-N-associated membrane domain-containing protein [Streptomyces]|uniref:TRADD-N-associated membrane domain-containing protein n=1 Tax=Streptomyces TaxID=1883 RepID=UPI001F1CB910|nr:MULTISPECIES: hypothetical protein [Streptomyces]